MPRTFTTRLTLKLQDEDMQREFLRQRERIRVVTGQFFDWNSGQQTRKEAVQRALAQLAVRLPVKNR